MPKRTDIRHILVIGSGPIVIGQACEFDYSGTQACRVLRSEGYRVSLINSNPATIMTDPEFADATYIEPLTPEFVEKVIEAERPGRAAADPGRADRAEPGRRAARARRAGALRRRADRRRHRGDPARRGPPAVQGDRRLGGCARRRRRWCATPSRTRSTFAATVDNKVVIRPSFTMGGLGSGLAGDAEEVRTMVARGLAASPVHEVLVEESVLGWKEFELELMRDKPRQRRGRLLDREHRPDGRAHRRLDHGRAGHDADRPRVPAHARRRHRGAARGRGRHRRLQHPVRDQPRGRADDRDRDEPAGVALVGAGVSKATGFPIAKIAAKLAVGYTLDEIPNDITAQDAGRVRADAGLRRRQGAAVRVREVPRRRPGADDAHEERRRGDGDRAQLHRGAGQGAALDGDEGCRLLDDCPTARSSVPPKLLARRRRPDRRPAVLRRAGAA